MFGMGYKRCWVKVTIQWLGCDAMAKWDIALRRLLHTNSYGIQSCQSHGVLTLRIGVFNLKFSRLYLGLAIFFLNIFFNPNFAIQLFLLPTKTVSWYWYIMWKSRGVIILNVSPREIPKPWPWPRDLPRGYIHHYPPRLFHIISFFSNPAVVKGIIFAANVAPRESHGEYTPSFFTNIESVKTIILRLELTTWSPVPPSNFQLKSCFLKNKNKL